MEGILNIDKPGGLTSHDVVARVRRAAQQRRVGHTGTLDPLATGVLVVCLGRATRLVEYVVGLPKTYAATIRLGQTTDSYDADGEIVRERPVDVSDAALDAALDQFRGPIMQVPPRYSALKKDGQPLYKLARRGEVVEVPARPVTIYALDRVGRSADTVSLRVQCSTGTYIRSLAHDLGEALGCGGHIVQLRRTAVGRFTADDALPLAELSAETLAASLQPAEAAVVHLPRLACSAAATDHLLNGRPVAAAPADPSAELARAAAPDGRFIGVVRREDDVWRAHKMFPLLVSSGSD